VASIGYSKVGFLLTFYVTSLYLFNFSGSKLLNSYVFPNKKRIITVLRAPCNHKKSKEQYETIWYKGLISIKVVIHFSSIYNFYFLKWISNYFNYYIKISMCNKLLNE